LKRIWGKDAEGDIDKGGDKEYGDAEADAGGFQDRMKAKMLEVKSLVLIVDD
jgi:hypothetical protein